MKAIRYSIYAVVGLLVLLAGAVAIFVMTFDPNKYETPPQAAPKTKSPPDGGNGGTQGPAH